MELSVSLIFISEHHRREVMLFTLIVLKFKNQNFFISKINYFGVLIKSSQCLKFRKVWKPTRKYFLNLIYFVLSTIIVVAIWPHSSKESWIRILGTLILVSSCYLVLYLFLSHFRSEVLDVTRKTLFIILMILSFIVLTRFVIDFCRIKMYCS